MARPHYLLMCVELRRLHCNGAIRISSEWKKVLLTLTSLFGKSHKIWDLKLQGGETL